MYNLVLGKKASKDLKKVDKKNHARIYKAFLLLQKDPYIGKQLKGDYEKCFSYRVWPYRIIYSINKGKLLIIIVRIGHRQGVYKR